MWSSSSGASSGIASKSTRIKPFPGPGAEFSHGNHIGVVGGDFLDDAGQAGATAMLNVPGKEFHGFP
jgi:hypothetical protein